MTRRRKILLASLAVLLLSPIAIVVAARAMRGHHDDAEVVHGGVLHLRNLFTDTYGARIGDEVVLFDTGIDTEGRALDALLAALHAKRDDVREVFLTHGHFDHVAASPLLTRAHVRVGRDDVEMMARRAPIEPAAARWFERMLPVGPVIASEVFDGRSEVALLDGKKLVALPLPGHTPGSYLLYFDGVLFAGDSLQISDGKLTPAEAAFSVDVAANRRNLAHLKSALDGLPIAAVCTGHQGCTSDGAGQRLLDDLLGDLLGESSRAPAAEGDAAPAT